MRHLADIVDCMGVSLESIKNFDPGRVVTANGWSDGPVLQPGDSWTADLGNGIVISGIVPLEIERRD